MGFSIPGRERDGRFAFQYRFEASGMVCLCRQIIGRRDWAVGEKYLHQLRANEFIEYSVSLGTPHRPNTCAYSVSISRREDVLALCRAGKLLIDMYLAALGEGRIPRDGDLSESIVTQGDTMQFHFCVGGFRRKEYEDGCLAEQGPLKLMCNSLSIAVLQDGQDPRGIGHFTFYSGLKDAIALAEDLMTLEGALQGHAAHTAAQRVPIWRGVPSAMNTAQWAQNGAVVRTLLARVKPLP